jgi:hypothetical protein
MYRGDEREMTFSVFNPDGTAANLTGKRLIFTARTQRGTTTFSFQKTTADGGIVVSTPLTGIATMTIEESDTSGFTQTITLAYTLTVDDNPGSKVTVATGTLVVEVP